MNDDLIILVSFISKQKTLDKLVIHVEHGLNNGVLVDYEYYNEPKVFANYMKLLPDHVASNVDYVVGVEEINDVISVRDNK